MKWKFETEEEALKVVTCYGATVKGDIIFPPTDIPFSRFMQTNKDKFWDAMHYLQMEHDYRNGNNVPFNEPMQAYADQNQSPLSSHTATAADREIIIKACENAWNHACGITGLAGSWLIGRFKDYIDKETFLNSLPPATAMAGSGEECPKCGFDIESSDHRQGCDPNPVNGVKSIFEKYSIGQDSNYTLNDNVQQAVIGIKVDPIDFLVQYSGLQKETIEHSYRWVVAAFEKYAEKISSGNTPVKVEEGWIMVDEKDEFTLPPVNTVVLGFNELWVDEDFEPAGIRETLLLDGIEKGWQSAKWNGNHDCWFNDEETKPTQWMQRPLPPYKKNK